MKFSSTKLTVVIASAALAATGCTKKPMRPDPNQTILGQPIGPASTAPSGVDFGANQTPGLVDRTGGFDPAGMNRDLLKGNTVYFDFDKSDIKPAEREKLKAAKDYLDKNPTHRLLVEGHCDWRGTAEYNLSLGDRRANAVKKYLQTLGVPAARLETLSKGSLEAAKNADESTMSKDRRGDLIVIDPSRAGTNPL